MVNRVLERQKLRKGKGKDCVRDALELSWTRDKARDTRTLLEMPTKVGPFGRDRATTDVIVRDRPLLTCLPPVVDFQSM